jgi:hypothetical protein
MHADAWLTVWEQLAQWRGDRPHTLGPGAGSLKSMDAYTVGNQMGSAAAQAVRIFGDLLAAACRMCPIVPYLATALTGPAAAQVFHP